MEEESDPKGIIYIYLWAASEAACNWWVGSRPGYITNRRGIFAGVEVSNECMVVGGSAVNWWPIASVIIAYREMGGKYVVCLKE